MNGTGTTRYRLLLGCLVGFLALALTGCNTLFPLRYAPNPVAAPDVPTQNLLLGAEAFPPGWIVHQCDPCDRMERNGESRRGFYVPEVPGQTNQTVLYFNTESAAHIKFERYKETDLPETVDPDTVQTPSTVFLQPPEIVYRSPLADEQYLGCGVSVVPTCRAGLRYGNYFVYFHFDLRASYYAHYLDESVADEMLYEGGLSLSEVERVLQAMDEHYVELFDLQLPGADTE